MRNLFQFSKDQLVEAFKIYNTEAIENPDSFGAITADENTALGQAEKLLSILEDIKNTKIQQGT